MQVNIRHAWFLHVHYRLSSNAPVDLVLVYGCNALVLRVRFHIIRNARIFR